MADEAFVADHGGREGMGWMRAGCRFGKKFWWEGKWHVRGTSEMEVMREVAIAIAILFFSKNAMIRVKGLREADADVFCTVLDSIMRASFFTFFPSSPSCYSSSPRDPSL